ncbi:MAG: lysozyme [Muribaculaceae bacterium]|nr:lysozyme [Muribaculaceae bacterium]
MITTESILIPFLKAHEGLRLQAYRCPAGVWTIGYGHTEGVRPGDYLEADRAEAILRSDVAPVLEEVRRMASDAGVKLSARKEAALTSFAFNVGIEALRRSTLWRRVCADPGNPMIAAEFARWIHAGGKVVAGLVKRRADEAALYFSKPE